jgi:hypothetical protein
MFLAGVLQPPLVLYFYIENLIFWARIFYKQRIKKEICGIWVKRKRR